MGRTLRALCLESSVTSAPNPVAYIDGYDVVVQGFTISCWKSFFNRFDTDQSAVEENVGDGFSKFLGSLKWKPYVYAGYSFNNIEDFYNKVETCRPDEVMSMVMAGKSMTEIIKFFVDRQNFDVCTVDSITADRLIGKTEVVFSRDVDNVCARTFDFICVSISLCGISGMERNDRMLVVKNNIRALRSRAVNGIKNTQRFKNSGFPIGALKCTGTRLLKDCTIEFMFQLKDSLLNMK